MGTYQCFFAAILSLLALAHGSLGAGCAARRYGEDAEDGLVCVCNATFCDQSGEVQLPPAGQLLHYSTSKAGQRLDRTTRTFSADGSNGTEARVTVQRSKVYQQVFGFGGAMTDAAGINIASLSEDARENLLRSYFSPEGLHYNILRVPMAGSDFSTHTYSYDDIENDVTLAQFNLTAEDYAYKIPYIKRAQELSSRRLLLAAAPWSAPKWMKTNNEFYGKGKLKTEFYSLWAEYFVRFAQQYAAAGLELWAFSTQNEPTDGDVEDFSFNCMGWNASEQRDWVGQYLGPALAAAGLQHLHVQAMDDQRTMLDRWPQVVLADATAKSYISGLAVHWYTDMFADPALLDNVHDLWPDVYLMYTEACNGVTQIGEAAVVLGSWERGEKYASNIIQTMNHWVTGWLDWNLALDLGGGPNWANNFVDSAIIVNATADEFYKQPMFYALGHFSKFVPEGSTRVHLDADVIEGTAFVTPEGATVVVLLNTLSEEVTAVVADPDRGETVVTLPAKSIHTLTWA